MTETILEIVLPTLAAVIAGLISWALRLLAKKLGLQNEVLLDQALRGAVRAAIHGAEEWAARKLKVDGKKPDGPEKTRWVLDRLRSMYPTLSDSTLLQLIDEELAQVNPRPRVSPSPADEQK